MFTSITSPSASQRHLRKVSELLTPVLPSVCLRTHCVANPHGATAFGVAVPDVEIVVSCPQQGEAAKYQKSLIRSCRGPSISKVAKG